MSIIGENIKKLRTANNLTQKDLADILHVTSSTLSRWEHGSRVPSSEDIDNISAFFSVPRSAICPEDTIVIKKSHLKVILGALILILLFMGCFVIYKYSTEWHYKLIFKEESTDIYNEPALKYHYLLPSKYTEKSLDSMCYRLEKKVLKSPNSSYSSFMFYFYSSKEDFEVQRYSTMYMVVNPNWEGINE